MDSWIGSILAQVGSCRRSEECLQASSKAVTLWVGSMATERRFTKTGRDAVIGFVVGNSLGEHPWFWEQDLAMAGLQAL